MLLTRTKADMQERETELIRQIDVLVKRNEKMLITLRHAEMFVEDQQLIARDGVTRTQTLVDIKRLIK